jgi:hypothetical protein
MASLAHAPIVDEARVAPPSFDPAPLIGMAEEIAPSIARELHRKRSSASCQADSVRLMDHDSGALFALLAKLTREVGNAP